MQLRIPVVRLGFGFAALLLASVNAVAVPSSAQNATAFALVYGYPLLPYRYLTGPILSSVGANTIANQYTLPNSSSTFIVRPNVDTLYSTAAVDLSHQNLVLTLPEIGDDRFWVVPFYDIYGNNFYNLGSLNNSKAGTYLIQAPSSASPTPDIGHGPESSAKYQGFVQFPTTYGLMETRILVRNNNTDVETVNDLQRNVTLTTVNRTTTLQILAPSLTVDLLNGTSLTATPEQLLSLTAKIAPYDNPENKSNITSITSTLALAGLQNGQYTAPANQNINLTAAQAAANASILAQRFDPNNLTPLSNNWTMLAPSVSGNFESHYAVRALVAEDGYLQLAPYEALYPIYTELAIGKGRSKLFTFYGKPDVLGFWSLTVYGLDQYLVPNGLNRYALGDRSGITYPDGELVYGNGTGSDGDRDGMFQILVQPADEVPGGNWTSNWIPSPAGGDNITVNLRWYGATESLINGSYVYPLITSQAAFGNDTSGDEGH